MLGGILQSIWCVFNEDDDATCNLIQYSCLSLGVTTLDRRNIREGMTKVVANPEELKKCPHADQVKYGAIFHINAKGPIFARSLTRKILGNEEFCMQVDAHTSFAKDWDEMVLEEWHNTENEFGVITSVPPPKSEQESYTVGGSKGNRVPRQCKIDFRENHFPVSLLVEGVLSQITASARFADKIVIATGL